MKETVLSVGIDIGTSTTQLVFSEIIIENMASMVSVPQIKIMDKRIIYRSEVYFTPLLSPQRIDNQRVRALVEDEYRRANIRPQQVQTGAVIITGETARKENAAEVLAGLSGLAGEFVVATAGPALEGILAGKGAHAHIESRERGAVVANFDIGGGTTNIAIFKNGEVVDTSCLDIGGRLIQFADTAGTVSYISTKAALLAQHLGIQVRLGEPLALSSIEQISERMVALFEEVLGLRTASPLLAQMATDKLLTLNESVEYLSFSGGVADCMKRVSESPFRYGDIGYFLGRALANSQIFQEKKVLEAHETIRATVVGAGSHTTDISGSTVAFADHLLPLQNIPIIKLSAEDECRSYPEWADKIAEKLQWFDEESSVAPALAFHGPETISFAQLQELAAAIVAGMASLIERGAPLIVVVESDLAKALGQTLRLLLRGRSEVISLDSIKVEDGDYIDIGKSLAGGKVVPVIVKTLVFGY